MFCPNCGKADQEEQTYCRQCGEALPKLKNRSFERTPQQQLVNSQFLTVMTGLTGIGLGLALLYHYWGAESVHLINFLAIVFSFVIGFWQASVFFVNWNVSRQIARHRTGESGTASGDSEGKSGSAETNELLSEANLEDIVPSSVTESTTRDLKERVKRSS